MALRPKVWIALMIGALLAAGCGPGTNDPLKPPTVRIYRPPQVWVTHAAPTVAATEVAEAEPATEAAEAVQPWAGPTLDEQQYLMDEIESLLTKIESKLDRTDVNP